MVITPALEAGDASPILAGPIMSDEQIDSIKRVVEEVIRTVTEDHDLSDIGMEYTIAMLDVIREKCIKELGR